MVVEGRRRLMSGYPYYSLKVHRFARLWFVETRLQHQEMLATHQAMEGPPPLEMGEAMIVGMTLSVYYRLLQVQKTWTSLNCSRTVVHCCRATIPRIRQSIRLVRNNRQYPARPVKTWRCEG